MKFRENKKCVDLFIFVFHKFQGIQCFYTKFLDISMVQGAKINSRLEVNVILVLLAQTIVVVPLYPIILDE